MAVISYQDQEKTEDGPNDYIKYNLFDIIKEAPLFQGIDIN